MGDANFDRNLLFGVLALQDELIDADQFADLCAGWALRRDKTLAELLMERGWIGADDRDAIDRRLERKIAKHGGDVRATLQAIADGLNVRAAPAVRR